MAPMASPPGHRVGDAGFQRQLQRHPLLDDRNLLHIALVAFSGGPTGTVSFQPSGPYTAKLNYTVTGVGTVTKLIQRQTLTAITVGGAYIGGQSGAYSGCNIGANDGTYRISSIYKSLNSPIEPSLSRLPTKLSIALSPERSCRRVIYTACPALALLSHT
jgi:hypothetical protein